jgi:neutral ceramidase
MTGYNIGLGMSDVDSFRIGGHMLGFAEPGQTITGVAMPLFARAAIIEDPATGTRVCLAVADIWTATSLLKAAVLENLARWVPAGPAEKPLALTDQNLMLMGTHTHSGPAGYAEEKLYGARLGGIDLATVRLLARTIAAAIITAHLTVSPGRVLYHELQGTARCGGNRSRPAFDRNPQKDKDRYLPDGTDRTMRALIFQTLDGQPRGMINWYAIHCTDMGDKNTKIHGDNKGYAARYLYSAMANAGFDGFVGMFANGAAGDVSGNVDFGQPPDGIHDDAHAQQHGRIQSDLAQRVLNTATEEVSGPLSIGYKSRDMSNVVASDGMSRTYAPAIGLSLFAGSTEDGTPGLGLREGITVDNMIWTEKLMQGALQAFGTKSSGIAGGIGPIIGVLPGLLESFGDLHADPVDKLGSAAIAGHAPKPITLNVTGLVASVLPLQVFRIGQVTILGVPAELTTVAGGRLADAVKAKLATTTGQRGGHCIIAGYANAYAQYITTFEEYQAQHYEGASTLFGPHTLAAFMSEFVSLV